METGQQTWLDATADTLTPEPKIGVDFREFFRLFRYSHSSKLDGLRCEAEG